MSDQKTEQKYTPGPWSQGYSEAGIDCVWLGGLTEPEHSMGPDDTWIACNTPANARLIAAAPELLEALREAVERERNPFEPDNQSRYHLKWSALIAKATGGQP